jgi:Deoxyribonuclease II
MGNCLCGDEDKDIFKVALKFPHGITGIVYKDEFEKTESIDDWIQSLYKNKKWTGFIVYNDQTDHLKAPSFEGEKSIEGKEKEDEENKKPFCPHTKGHAKGIVAWNEKKVSWLIHSVPNFPRYFDGETISPIEKSEHMYGQSFMYVEVSSNLCQEIVNCVHKMHANVYLSKNEPPLANSRIKPKDAKFQELHLNEFISHVAKPPALKQDIYKHIANYEEGEWLVETWKRGHEIEEGQEITCCWNGPKSSIREVKRLSWKDVEWKESNDHSKWAVSESYVWIGDLNRMTSQFTRGGGGFLIKNPKLAKAFRKLVVE